MFSKVSFHLPVLILAFLLFCFPAFAQTAEGEAVFTLVDVMPEFKKGNMAEYLKNEIKYPEDARENKIQGRVFVNFVVAEDGKLLNFKVLRGIGYGCDEEAVNAIMTTSGFWEPGKNQGKPVKVMMNVPVVFSLSPLPPQKQ